MKKIFAGLLICITAIFETNAQQMAYFNDGDGKPVYYSRTNIRTEGSAFLYDDYRPASLLSLSGNWYENVMTKLNIATGEIIFLKPGKEEMILQVPIKEIRWNAIGSNAANTIVAWPSIINHPSSVILQLIISGKASICKKIQVTYREETQYGQAGTVGIYERKKDKWIVVKDEQLQSMPGSKKAILTMLSDKRSEVESFIATKKFSRFNEKELIEIFTYYNTLQ